MSKMAQNIYIYTTKLFMMKKTLLLGLAFSLALTSCKKDDDDPAVVASFDGNLSITNSAELLDAQELTEDITSLSGDLTIFTGASSGITVADANAFTTKITSVGGDVDVRTPDGSLDLSNLTSVGGDYSVSGKDANDANLSSVGGDIVLFYPGDYSMPNLTSAGDIDLIPFYSSSAKNANAGEINFPRVNARSISTVGHRDGMLDFNTVAYTSISLGPDVYIDYIIANFATTIVSEYAGALDELVIYAPVATSVNLSASSISGPVNVDMGENSSFTAASLTTLQGNIDIEAGSVAIDNVTTIQGNISIEAATITANSVQEISGNLKVETNTISMSSLSIIGGNLSVEGIVSGEAAASVNFAELTTVGGDIAVDADEIIANNDDVHNSGGNGQPHNSGGNGHSHNSGGN